MGYRLRRRLGLLLILLVVAGVLFFWWRSGTGAVGPMIALCPGPDLYGYTCQSGAGFAYLDATQDSQLYADDGMVSLSLPFPFQFYGTTYTEVQVSSNGNIQFGNANPWYINACMSEGVVPDMGDMIAPYWDDLDLRAFGFLEYETVGQAPERIFVIEWDDVPRFGDDSGERVTFEVQLFETSHDILFLYQDVTTLNGFHGDSATIGLQSEAQGVALQYGCYQPVLADASGIHFPHPAKPNRELGLETTSLQEHPLASEVAFKGAVADLVDSLNARGPGALTQLRQSWLNQFPPRASSWRWVDLTGNGHRELVLLWRGPVAQPALTQLVVLEVGENEQTSLLFDQLLSARQHMALAQAAIVETVDLTHDGVADLLLGDKNSGQMFLFSWSGEALIRYPLPERCDGSAAVLDHDADGQLEVWRSECSSGPRSGYRWNGLEFEPVQLKDRQ
jgi:hypothetical protein